MRDRGTVCCFHAGFHEVHQWADLMEEVQQQRIVRLPSKVLLQHSVDAGLQDDVVVTGHQAHLQPDTSSVNTAEPSVRPASRSCVLGGVLHGAQRARGCAFLLDEHVPNAEAGDE